QALLLYGSATLASPFFAANLESETGLLALTLFVGTPLFLCGAAYFALKYRQKTLALTSMVAALLIVSYLLAVCAAGRHLKTENFQLASKKIASPLKIA